MQILPRLRCAKVRQDDNRLGWFLTHFTVMP